MKNLLILMLSATISACAPPQSKTSNSSITLGSIASKYETSANRLIEAALKDTSGFERLAEMCDTFGPRFSGTDNLEKAIDWILSEMNRDGLSNVHGEAVMVPKWVRGNESAHMVSPWKKELHMLGLGGSIGTAPEGITADVMVVSSFDELEDRSDEAKGKIVLFNVPFTNYGKTVRYRSGGAVAASKAGAVASIIRSVGPYSMNTPHTGNSRYEDGVKKIPHAAITVEDVLQAAKQHLNFSY